MPKSIQNFSEKFNFIITIKIVSRATCTSYPWLQIRLFFHTIFMDILYILFISSCAFREAQIEQKKESLLIFEEMFREEFFIIGK
jgi:hypothetical protein